MSYLVILRLVTTSHNKQPIVLLDKNKECPQINVVNNITTDLNTLISTTVDLSIEWLRPKLFDIETIDNTMYVYYKITIPNDIPVNLNYQWYNVEDTSLLNKAHLLI